MLSWRSLPVKLAATLAAGLPPDSRSQMLLRHETVTQDNTLRAIIADALNRLEWRMFGTSGSPMPPSILSILRGEAGPEDSGSVRSFDSPEEFETAMAAIQGGEQHGD